MKHKQISFKVNEATLHQRNEILKLLSTELLDSMTELLNPPKDLPYFGQYGIDGTWGCVSEDILFTTSKIIPVEEFIIKLKDKYVISKIKKISI